MAKDEKQHTSDNFKSTADLTSNPGFQSSLSVISKNVDEKAYNPFEHRNLEHPNSFIGSVLHLLKACIGTGILAMPAAFKNSGFVVGIVGTLLSGVICTHTVHIFVRTSQQVCIDAKKPSMSFAETCGAAFSYGPKRLQPLGEYMKTFMDICMTFTYLAVCSVYVVFIGSSFKEVLDVYYPDLHLSIQTYCALTLVPIVLICQIRNLKYIVPFSAIANFLILIVFSITMYYVFTDLPSIKEREMIADVKQWPLFLSTVVFAMEGIGVVMPVENEMKKPHKFLGCPGVLNISMVTVIFLFTIFGFFGYLQYGDDVKGSITLNLPQDHLIAQSAKLLMAIVIFFSFPIQFYVPIDIISKYLEKRAIKHINLVQIFMRTVIISAIVAVAVLFPNLELAISLVGAVFFSTLGLLTPAIVDTVYHWDKNLGPCNYVLWKNLVIGIISIIALVSGSYVSIISMYEQPSTDDLVGENHVNSTLV